MTYFKRLYSSWWVLRPVFLWSTIICWLLRSLISCHILEWITFVKHDNMVAVIELCVLWNWSVKTKKCVFKCLSKCILLECSLHYNCRLITFYSNCNHQWVNKIVMDQLKFITRFPYLIEFQRNGYIGILHLKVGNLSPSLYCTSLLYWSLVYLLSPRRNRLASTYHVLNFQQPPKRH